MWVGRVGCLAFYAREFLTFKNIALPSGQVIRGQDRFWTRDCGVTVAIRIILEKFFFGLGFG
jgi:hypothetical protein